MPIGTDRNAGLTLSRFLTLSWKYIKSVCFISQQWSEKLHRAFLVITKTCSLRFCNLGKSSHFVQFNFYLHFIYIYAYIQTQTLYTDMIKKGSIAVLLQPCPQAKRFENNSSCHWKWRISLGMLRIIVCYIRLLNIWIFVKNCLSKYTLPLKSIIQYTITFAQTLQLPCSRIYSTVC